MTGILAPQPRHPTASALTAAPSSAPPILSPIPRKAPRPTSKASTPKTPSRPPSRTERKFTCSFVGCSKAYFKPSRLSEHMRTHTGERPHVCDECGQTYLRASHLAAHLRTHKSEADKEFACTREGCGKKFWTAAHLQRHEASHDTAEEHKCEQCTDVFPKTHLLREHVASAHMPAGSKPWACTTEDCGRSFSTKQQLRTHEKTHDPTRYTCSHPIHGFSMPTFPVWSALQAHIRDAHPPTCPHAECEGRTFKSSGRLREHLRVHAEREADIAAGRATSDTDDLPPVLAEAGGRRKKRKLSDVDDDPRVIAALKAEGTLLGTAPSSGAASPYIPTTPTSRKAKLPRLTAGEAGKDWICGAPGCGKAFKTKFSRDEHAQAAHSTGRHKCDVCGRSYRRPASLKRHQAQGWCGEGEHETEEEKEGRGASALGSGAGSVAGPCTPRTRSRGGVDPVPLGDLLTGTATLPGGSLHRRWACPYVYKLPPGTRREDVLKEWAGEGVRTGEDDHADEDEDEDEATPGSQGRGDGDGTESDADDLVYCPERFHRVYDVRRHLASTHKMVLSDMGTREMLLADGQTGEDDV